jgi:hypothetical protein
VLVPSRPRPYIPPMGDEWEMIFVAHRWIPLTLASFGYIAPVSCQVKPLALLLSLTPSAAAA